MPAWLILDEKQMIKRATITGLLLACFGLQFSTGTAHAQFGPAAGEQASTNTPLSYTVAGAAPGFTAPPGAYLRLAVNGVNPGTYFRAKLHNTIDTSYNQAGDEFVATMVEPISTGGVIVVPRGSKLMGKITESRKARRFRFGSPGRLKLEFFAVEFPDGRRFPISASVRSRSIKRIGGIEEGSTNKTLRSAGRGTLRGAMWGAGVGAVASAAAGRGWSSSLRGAGEGAVAGSALGASVGLISAGVKKGKNLVLRAGTIIPVRLDARLDVVDTPQPELLAGSCSVKPHRQQRRALAQRPAYLPRQTGPAHEKTVSAPVGSPQNLGQLSSSFLNPMVQ